MTPAEAQSSNHARDQRKRLAAVMFADMVGYSKRIEQDEVSNSDQATRSIALFKSLIGDYGGHVANVAGDGILALFDNAETALRFAIQIQTEFRDQSVWSDGEPIQFRIGLNVGEVMVDDANVQGHCVNVAARLQAMAEPDSILVTDAIRSALPGTRDIPLRSLGRQALKNISEQVEIFEVERPGPKPARLIAESRPTPPEPLRNPSVAVLALTNLSGDPRNDHLCEGIAEDIIANLTRFRSLMVIAQHSAFLFNLKAHPVQEVRQRLGVRYVLGGSLRRADGRLRIAVELIDAASETALWSDRFNVEIQDLFDVQDEIAGAVAARLSVQIDFAERRQESPYPRDMRAYGLVLRGQHLVLRFTKEANWHARRLFEEALAIAPGYSRAYSALSRTHNLDWRYSWSASPEASLDAAMGIARTATGLDRLDARAFAELGYAMLYKRQHDESLAEYARALALNPNDADIIVEYADALVYARQPQRSVELLQKAMRLNPYYPDWYLWYLADAYNAMGRPLDVISAVQRMQDPAEGRRLLAANFAHLGMLAEARAEAREVMRLHPGFTISQWRHRPPYQDRAVLERYIDGLRKAGLPE